MLIRILSFLLDSLFFILVGAALLRAWMNWLRVNMRAQPGQFVMAVSDWIVKPLRRALPTKWTQSRIDWASVVAGLLMAMVYALISAMLVAVATPSGFGVPDSVLALTLGIVGLAIKMLIRVLLQGLFFLVLAFAVLSWVQPGSTFHHQLGRVVDPLLAPLRRMVPTVGGVDLSALVLMLVLQIGLMILG